MKRHVLIALMMFLTITGHSQELDKGLKIISEDLSTKIARRGKGKLALADFINIENKTDGLTSYIYEQVESNLANSVSLQVMDRNHIRQILKEHSLQSQGLIDEAKAKSVIAFIKVDGWVFGEITVFGDYIKLKLKVIDVSTSQIYATSSMDIFAPKELRTLLVAKACDVCNGSGMAQLKISCTACGGIGGKACYSCGGVGNPYNGLTGRKQACETCGGKGKIACSICNGTGQKVSYNTCTKCKGSGKIY